MEMARNLFDAGLDPLHVTSTSERCAAFADLDLESNEKAFLAWMANEVVLSFIRSIPGIVTYSEAYELYSRHMRRAGSMESHARGTRKAAENARYSNGESCCNDSAKAKTRAYVKHPTWYDFYRLTEHWRSIRLKALDYYDSCVLCGLKDATLETHHRHYNTLGREQMKHVSVLCSDHHKKIHTMLGIHCPREIPSGASEIFLKEGIVLPQKGAT